MLLSSLWGSFASCAPVCYRRNWRVANPPDPEGAPPILPHKNHSTWVLGAFALLLDLARTQEALDK